MGYGLFITRACGWSETEHWSETGSQGISFEEWERLVNDDPHLAIDYSGRLSWEETNLIVDSHPDFVGCRIENGGLQFSKEQFQFLKELARDLKQREPYNVDDFGSDEADWTAHPEGEPRSFWFEEGTIETKNPDVATLDKMLELSRRLNACVRGDDGEIYRRSERGFDCYEPQRGWLPLEECHRGRPDWAPTIIREIVKKRY